MNTSQTRLMLDDLYDRLNQRKFVHPDPLEFLYHYDDPCDREIVALIASSLAYGRVAQILKSIKIVLDVLGPAPAEFIKNSTPAMLRKKFYGFKHRFNTHHHIVELLNACKKIVNKYGSLGLAFAECSDTEDETVLPALRKFVNLLKKYCKNQAGYLLADPEKTSACKRLMLMLRWLIRNDDVDPGGWEAIGKKKLLIPLDTHMFQIATIMKMTDRKSADMKTVIQITDAFRKINPEDPTKYDFSLTRLGIRDDMNIRQLNQLIKTYQADAN